MKTKFCTKCEKELALPAFYKSDTGTLGTSSWCKMCLSSITKADEKDKPWYRAYHRCWNRCNEVGHLRYPSYGGRGLRLEMTPSDFKELWFRDKAYRMKNPSLSRRNETNPKRWHYTKGNSFYEELGDNIRRAIRRRRSKLKLQREQKEKKNVGS